jgi:adenylylsulfate kinase-like enzyme
VTTDRVHTVLLTGTIGSGKNAVAAEIGEVLEERGLPTAVIDLDWLGWFHRAPDGDFTTDSLIMKNLAATWPNFLSAGMRYAVLVRAIESRAQIDELRRTLPDTEVTVVRLTASPNTISERLRRRDTGAVLEEHLVQAVELERALDDAHVDDVRVANENRPIREVAEEVVRRLGWA